MMALALDAARQRRLGVLLIVASAVSWSFGGVFAKLVTVDAWTAAFYRALAAASFLAIVLVVQQRGRAIETLMVSARAAPQSILVGAVSMVILIGAFFGTTVANVTVIYATAPFWSAAMLWVLFAIRPNGRTLVASALALMGVAVVVGGGFDPTRFAGDLMALAMTATFIYAAIILKRSPEADSTAVTLLSCIACALIVAPFASFTSPSRLDFVWLTLFGVMTSGLAYLCFLSGARLISTTDAGLIGVIEVALAPFWSYVILSEVPPATTFIGGAVIIAVVVWFLRGQRQVGEAA